MYVLLMLFATLLHATSTANAINCWTGYDAKLKVASEKASHEGSFDMWNLKECPAGVERCTKLTCTMDTEALRELAEPGRRISDGLLSTITAKGCLKEGKCEIADEADGKDLRKQKKYCRVSCCTGNACNGTLEMRCFGTVAAIIAFVAAFFVSWN